MAERVLTLLGNAPSVVFDLIRRHGIACEAEHAGTLHCAHGKSGLDEITARAEQWHKRGADVELLDADQAAKKLGTSKYAGALLDRRAGTIQPLAYARGLATAALKAGARIFTKSPVRAIDRKDGRWQVHGDDAAISAEWVIVATDAYGTGPGLPARKEQVLLPYFNFATKPLPPDLRATILPEKQGAWDTQLGDDLVPHGSRRPPRFWQRRRPSKHWPGGPSVLGQSRTSQAVPQVFGRWCSRPNGSA